MHDFRDQLDLLIEWWVAMMICCDSGPEYISLTMGAWAEKSGTKVRFIQSGKT